MTIAEFYLAYLFANIGIGPLLRALGIRISIARLLVVYACIFAIFCALAVSYLIDRKLGEAIYKLWLMFACFALTSPALLTKSPTIAFFAESKNFTLGDLYRLREFFEGLKIPPNDEEIKELFMIRENGSVTYFGQAYGFLMHLLRLHND